MAVRFGIHAGQISAALGQILIVNEMINAAVLVGKRFPAARAAAVVLIPVSLDVLDGFFDSHIDTSSTLVNLEAVSDPTSHVEITAAHQRDAIAHANVSCTALAAT
jgi:hypothetical protein